MRVSMLLFTILFALNMMDATLTTHFILTSDSSIETNPFLRAGIERYGIWFMWAFKSVMLALLGFALYHYKHSVVVNRVLFALILVYGYVVSHSLLVFYTTTLGVVA